MLGVAYVAVMTLVRMMARRRDQVVADVERQLEVPSQTSQKQAGQHHKEPRRRVAGSNAIVTLSPNPVP